MTGFASRYDPGVQVDPDEVLALHRNENLFVGREWTIDAPRQLVERAAISSYPDATSLPLRRALADVYGVGPENVFVGNGSDEVLADLLAHLRATYRAVHCLDVGFKVYPMLAERLGFSFEHLPGRTFETGRIAAAGFRGLALVDSPNGITGQSLDRDELLALADDERSFLIWDNAYGEYAFDEPPVWRANLAFVRSFSKFYALAGLRVGYCIADAGIVAELLEKKDAFNVNGMAQVMALEALRRHAYFAASRDELLECRDELVASLRGLGFEVLPSRFVAVLARHPERDAELLRRELLARKIAVRRFTDPSVASFIRITVAPRPVVRRLLDALAEIVA